MAQDTKDCGSLFLPEPTQWGLRGSPFLWRDMAQTLQGTPLPQTEKDLTVLLEQTFEQLTGIQLPEHCAEDTPYKQDAFYLKKYAHGGMSTGMIPKKYWRNYAFPLLLSRYREAKGLITGVIR